MKLKFALAALAALGGAALFGRNRFGNATRSIAIPGFERRER
jgi:hypothetical protein